MADDHGLPIQAADDRFLVVGDFGDPLARKHLGVLPGLGDGLWIVGPARRDGNVTGFLEERHPAVPARRQQPEAMNEHDRRGFGRVRAVNLSAFVVSKGRFGGRHGALSSSSVVTTGTRGVLWPLGPENRS